MRFFMVIEDRSPSEFGRNLLLVGDGGLQIGSRRSRSFDLAHESIQPFEAIEFFRMVYLRGIERTAEH